MGSGGPHILRLCSDAEYSPDSHNDIQISLPVLLEAEDPARFALLRTWLRWCDESHNCNKHNAKSKAALPTRLLYLGDLDPDVLRLYSPKEDDNIKYFALSHCWGKITENNKRQFCTTDDNINSRLKGFSLSELPKTFRDAIRVTRELGIHYLWIDSLCIIQWNQKDWEYEAERMEGVFASAYCTIAATSALDSNAGFLKRNVNNEYVLVQDALGRRFYICADTDDSNNHVDIDDFDDHVEKAPLNTRAWVMQERILSRRTIHFSDKQMYWECGEGVYCETLTRLKSSFRKIYFMLDPNFPDRLLESGDQRTIEFIQFLSEAYSKRDLTQETDRCVAISGLEARIASAIGCRSRYGIFEQHLHRNLLWQRSDGEKAKRIGYETGIVPSWSWMAYDGGIQFMEIPFGDVYWNKQLRFNKEHKQVFSNIFKRKGIYALVTDVGVFQNCSLEQRDISYAVLDSSKAERGRIWYDIESSGNLHTEWCVVVGRNSHKDEHGLRNEKYYILVVRLTSLDGEYTRVGVGWVQSGYVIRQRLNVRVV
ncbi:HET-domain-containing protein [Lepidopterella palustris CBS 459.81]|uniref:HET-domain-containing protein n=1 Tax=Lepidopterella palustris CBS 459.81 TaxID=1314670 RepID=A0A8E2EEZ8_9PEZI|nr:HET-domain-containing protein [Lepidopterella palustris CBS 459.81]